MNSIESTESGIVISESNPKDGEGNIFSLFTLAGGGAEVPHLRSGGGVPISGLRWGGTPARSRGVPHLRSEVGGYPSQV